MVSGIGITLLSLALAVFISVFALKFSADKVYSKRGRIGTWKGAAMQWGIVIVFTTIIYLIILAILFIVFGIMAI